MHLQVQVQVGLIAFSAVILSAIITWVGNVFLQRSMRSWQREQWLLDKKTAEYKELLTTLAASVESMAQNSPDFGVKLPSLLTDDQQRLAYDMAAGQARRTITDRIFIKKQVQAAVVVDLWQDLAGQRDLRSFWDKWYWLRHKIIETARDDLEIKGH
jgi:hypothetical protein